MVDVPLPTPRPPPPLPTPRPVKMGDRAPQGGNPQTQRLVSMARTAEMERAQEVAPVSVPSPGSGFQPGTQIQWNEQELRHLTSLWSPPGAGQSLDWLNAQENQRQEGMDALLYPPDPREVQRMQMTPATPDPMRGPPAGDTPTPGDMPPQSMVEMLNNWRVRIRNFVTSSGVPGAEPTTPPVVSPPSPGQTVDIPGQGTITLPAPPPGEQSVQDVLAESRRLIEEARERQNQNPRSSSRRRRRR